MIKAKTATPKLSVLELLESSLLKHQDRLFIGDGTESLTLGAFRNRVIARSAEFREEGLRPGGAKLLRAEKTCASAIDLFATWETSAMAVPIPSDFSDEQMALLVQEFNSADENEPRFKCGPPALVILTSGTTAKCKKVAFGPEALLAAARITAGYLEFQETNKVFSPLPLNFSYGLLQLLSCLKSGAYLRLCSSPFVHEHIEVLLRENISALVGVPSYLRKLTTAITDHRSNFQSDVRIITSAGGAMTPSLATSLRRNFSSAKIFSMYGSTETLRSTYLSPELFDAHPQSIGCSIAETTIEILNDKGEPCAPGVPGELVHSGPTLALGYWNDANLTEKKFGSAYYRTGDMGYRDDKGLLYWLGRKDGVVKRNGFLIDRFALEAELTALGVFPALVLLGRTGSQPEDIELWAVVEGDDGQIETFKERLRDTISGAYRPDHVVAVPSLPLTTSGKLDRGAIEKELEALLHRKKTP